MLISWIVNDKVSWIAGLQSAKRIRNHSKQFAEDFRMENNEFAESFEMDVNKTCSLPLSIPSQVAALEYN